MEFSIKSSGQNNYRQDIVWLEVKCNESENSGEDKPIEVKDINIELGENPGWLPDKIEKMGNWFLFDANFSKCSAVEDENLKDSTHILCANLSNGNDSGFTILFHFDYWKKQISSGVK